MAGSATLPWALAGSAFLAELLAAARAHTGRLSCDAGRSAAAACLGAVWVANLNLAGHWQSEVTVWGDFILQRRPENRVTLSIFRCQGFGMDKISELGLPVRHGGRLFVHGLSTSPVSVNIFRQSISRYALVYGENGWHWRLHPRKSQDWTLSGYPRLFWRYYVGIIM